MEAPLRLVPSCLAALGRPAHPRDERARRPRPAAQALWGSNLLAFDPVTPPSVVRIPMTGVTARETLVALDVRPVNGMLYVVRTTARSLTSLVATGNASFRLRRGALRAGRCRVEVRLRDVAGTMSPAATKALRLR